MSLLYVIDGYNLLNHPRFPRRRQNNPDPAKTLLEFILNNGLTGSRKNQVILVFDGYFRGESFTRDAQGGCAVIFSGDRSADEKIKSLVERSARPGQIVVVSDDKEIKFICRALGANILGVEDFIFPKKTRSPKSGGKSDTKDLSFTSMDRITKEVSKLWLKEKPNP